ncbi:MAG: hypothetical protein ACYDB6_07240 [Candidatus Limnocylindrales bacterium]
MLDLELAFTQRLLLTTTEFESACRERGLDLWPGELEAYDVAGVLHPMYVVRKNVRRARRQARRTGLPLFRTLESTPPLAGILRRERDAGQLTDGASGRVRSWARYRTRDGLLLAWSHDLFYAHWQLLAVPRLGRPHELVRMRRRRDGTWGARLNASDIARVGLDGSPGSVDPAQIVALLALEPLYLPPVMERIVLLNNMDREMWDDYRGEWTAARLLEWLGGEPDWYRQQGEHLLMQADRVDPLRDWTDLVRLARPRKWEELRGSARSALDLRVAAEVLLRFYEELAGLGLADPLRQQQHVSRRPLDGRLACGRGALDAVLMEFDLSPHPTVVLVLEGDTEWLLVPRCMALLGMDAEGLHIRLVNERGVTHDLGPLVAFAVTPLLGDPIGDGVEFARPPAHFVVFTDPERKMQTPGMRDNRKAEWVDRMFQASPPEYRTNTYRAELGRLVHIEAWPGDESFEYAHFTDDELATAILMLAGDPAPVDRATLSASVATRRKYREPLDRVWKDWDRARLSKLALADVLWPLLARRILDAIEHDELPTVPVAAALERVAELASRTPRSAVIVRTSEGLSAVGASDNATNLASSVG